MSVNLGRNCSISVAGQTLTTVRSVSLSYSASEIEFALYGSSAEQVCLPGARSMTIEVECIGSSDYSALLGAMNNQDSTVNVSGTHFSATCRVFSLSASEPLDDVVIYTATLKRSM